MTDPIRSIQTRAGELKVRPLEPDAVEKLGTLFLGVGEVEDDGRSLLAMLTVEGTRAIEGFRTGYGWFPEGEREGVEGMFGMERVIILRAAAAFRSRGFKGVLMPAACLLRSRSQLGELLFLRSQGPLSGGVVPDDPIRGYEESFGPGATDVLLSFVSDIISAWKAVGNEGMAVTDMEPCPAHWAGAQWVADILLIDDEVFLIRPELDPEDPLLPALVQSGIPEIRNLPSVLFIQPPEASSR